GWPSVGRPGDRRDPQGGDPIMLPVISVVHDIIAVLVAQDRAMARATPAAALFLIVGLQDHNPGAVGHAPAILADKGPGYLPRAAAGGVVIALRALAAEIIGREQIVPAIPLDQ